jgi:hypothetical protein
MTLPYRRIYVKSDINERKVRAERRNLEQCSLTGNVLESLSRSVSAATFSTWRLPLTLRTWAQPTVMKNCGHRHETTECPKSLEPIGILFIIYCLHYMLYMFRTLYAFSQPLYHVCADFAPHIGIDSSTTVYNSLPKVTKISDFNSIHLCL